MKNCINCKYFESLKIKTGSYILILCKKYGLFGITTDNKCLELKRNNFKPCKHYKKYKK